MARPRRLPLPAGSFDPLSHYWIRYPAKFHPPVAAKLLRQYTAPGDLVIDPFCGSGSLLVEALVDGRSAIGVDVDPIAVLASRVKTRSYDVTALAGSCERLLERIEPHRPDPSFYGEHVYRHGSEAWARQVVQREGLWTPNLPSLFHWFRPYAVVDLARIARAIRRSRVEPSHRDFIWLAFAASIRASSNADPVPVSGVEYTSYMRRLDDEGRVVDPFYNFERKLTRALQTLGGLEGVRDEDSTVRVRRGDATKLTSVLRGALPARADALITSPPYHNAVDYHRRHLLETFWLGLVEDQEAREQLGRQYIGRRSVRTLHRTRGASKLPGFARRWYDRIRALSPARASEFAHYALSMREVFSGAAALLKHGAPAVFVVGHSTWNGDELSTSALLKELAGSEFSLSEELYYPLENRYMSYSRHNSASIDREYVLVFERTRRHSERRFV
jgi:DNA methylase